jgi:hypothetical protein
LVTPKVCSRLFSVTETVAQSAPCNP